MLLLDYARETVGMPMRGFHVGRHVGWTTDGAKAEKMRAAGAVITPCHRILADRKNGAQRGELLGHEVSFAEGRHTTDCACDECATQTAAA